MTWSPPTIGLRLPGWESRLVETLQAHLAQPFAWGESDCLIVPADICKAMTGANPFPMRLRRYRTAAGAQRALLQLGFDTVQGPLEACFKRVPKALARRGDCGVRRISIEGVETLSAMVVLGNGTAVGKGMDGPVIVPVLGLDRTYAIGWEAPL